MPFYEVDPNTGKTVPQLDPNERDLQIAEAVGKELGQDLVKIKNAQIIIHNLVELLRAKK